MDAINIPKAIVLISILSGFVALFVGVAKVKFLQHKAIYAIIGLLIVSAAADLLGFYFVEKKIPTSIIYNIQDILQFGLLSWFYYEAVFKKVLLNAFLIGIASYLVWFVLITIYSQSFDQNQNWMWTISALIISVYAISLYHYLLDNVGLIDIPFTWIWINSGIFYYFGFTFGLFVMAEYMAEYIFTEFTNETSSLFWSFNNLNTIIKNVLITIGFSTFKQASSKSSFSI